MMTAKHCGMKISKEGHVDMVLFLRRIKKASQSPFKKK